MTGPAGAPAPAAWRVLAVAILVATIAGCGLSLLNALLAVRLHAAGFGGRAIGFSGAAGGLATLAFASQVPRLARRFGVARVFGAALGSGGLAMLSFTATEDFTAWLVLRVVEGGCATVMFVLSEFWISSWSPADRRGLVVGCYVTSLAIGFAAGPFLLATLGSTGDAAFAVAGGLFAGAALPLAANAGSAPLVGDDSRPDLLGFVRRVPLLAAAAVLHGTIEVAGLTFLPVYVLSAGGDLTRAATLVGLFVIGGSAAQLPLGLLADRVERRTLLVAVAAAGVCGAVALALQGRVGSVAFAALLFAWGGAVGAFYPLGLSELGRRVPAADMAPSNAAFIICYALGMLVGPPLVGVGLDLLPRGGLFWAMAVPIAVFLAAAGLLRRDPIAGTRAGTPRVGSRARLS